MSALCGLYLGAHALSGLNIPLCVYYCVSRLLSPPPLGNASQFPAPGVAPGRFYPYGSHALPHLCVYSATAQWCHAPVLPRLGLSFERRVTNGPCAEAMLRVYRLACMPPVFPWCHIRGLWISFSGARVGLDVFALDRTRTGDLFIICEALLPSELQRHRRPPDAAGGLFGCVPDGLRRATAKEEGNGRKECVGKGITHKYIESRLKIKIPLKRGILKIFYL